MATETNRMTRTAAVQQRNDSSDVNALLARSAEGDTAADTALRAVVDERPGLWDQFGDLTFQAEGAWVHRNAGKSSVVQDAIWRKVKAMRAELRGATSTPLERLLIDRIIICWLQMAHADALYGQNLGQLTIRQAEHQQRRVDSAHRRYLGAIKALAQVRRLLVPTLIQVNVAEQQIVAGQIGGPSPNALAAGTAEPSDDARCNEVGPVER
jgi:hypothetical protein